MCLHDVSKTVSGGRLAVLTVKLVDLLKGEIFGLVDEEIDKHHGNPAEATPDPEDVGFQIGVAWPISDHVRGDKCEGPIQEPIRGSRH